jgi:alpha-beta hydrolase superfamily lysophospholipase
MAAAGRSRASHSGRSTWIRWIRTPRSADESEGDGRLHHSDRRRSRAGQATRRCARHRYISDAVRGVGPSREIREDYITSYDGDKFAESIAYVQAYPDQLPILGTLLPGIQTPVRIVQGSEDQVVAAVNATYLGDRLPHSQVDFIAGAGHFCWEERPDDYAALVIAWWNHVAASGPLESPVLQ